MKIYIRILYLVLLAAALFACSAMTPATPAPQPTPSEGFYPLTTRTGIANVDNIVDVVAGGDVEILRSLIQFTNTKCTTADGLGGPPKCRAGEVEGTPVEVLPVYGSEGHSYHKEDIETWSGVNADGLYAVYEVSPDVVPDPDYPSGKYAVMFVDRKNQAIASLRIDNGKIVRFDYTLDIANSANGWIEREASNVILAPLN